MNNDGIPDALQSPVDIFGIPDTSEAPSWRRRPKEPKQESELMAPKASRAWSPSRSAGRASSPGPSRSSGSSAPVPVPVTVMPPVTVSPQHLRRTQMESQGSFATATPSYGVRLHTGQPSLAAWQPGASLSEVSLPPGPVPQTLLPARAPATAVFAGVPVSPRISLETASPRQAFSEVIPPVSAATTPATTQFSGSAHAPVSPTPAASSHAVLPSERPPQSLPGSTLASHRSVTGMDLSTEMAFAPAYSQAMPSSVELSFSAGSQS